MVSSALAGRPPTDENPVVITSGLNGRGSIENFVSDDPSYTKDSTDKSDTGAKTGDESPLALWITLMLASLIGMVSVALLWSRRDDSE